MKAPCLREFAAGLWVGEGPVVSFYGFPYSTRMAVIPLSGGGLFVWSPIALTAALKSEVDALGSVRCLVSPIKLHHLFLGEWQAAYPQARLYASPGLKKKRSDLRFDAELGDSPEPEWAADIDQVPLRGSLMTEVVFFHRASRTVLFTDLVQNFPPNPGAPREWRASFFNRRAARDALEKILAWPIERVLIAHGEPVTENGAAFVRRAFAWLLKPEPPAQPHA
jgi:hypothetical protein